MDTIREIRQYSNAFASASTTVNDRRSTELECELKRDFGCLLEFDIPVENYTENPLTIRYEFNGIEKDYTPDYLIKYSDEKKTEHVLVGINYREDIWNNWQGLKPKFKAAKEYASARGWTFKIYTENEIRLGAYLQNVKFLLYYRDNVNLPDVIHRQIILSIIEAVKITTPEEVILIVFSDENRRAELIPTLWHMVSTGLVGCNLLDKLTMSSEIWCVTD